MFDSRISTSNAAPMDVEDLFGAVQSMLSALDNFATAGHDNSALQYIKFVPTRHSLAAHYAAANSITRRRFDALLRETETAAKTGVALMAGRGGRDDRGTIAAARFLGKTIAGSLQRMENLLAPHAA